MNRDEELMERAKQCLVRLRLKAILPKLQEMLDDPLNMQKSPLQWIVELAEAEVDRREGNALKEKLRVARLRYPNADETSIDYSSDRNLKQAVVNMLITCEWIKRHQNCLITGKVGTGKTYLADCLAVAACRMGFKARAVRVPLLLQEFAGSHEVSGEYRSQLRALKKMDLLVLDDWGLGPLNAAGRADLLEIVEARHENGSTIITSVLPVSHWAEWIGDPTYADAVLDRLTASAIRIDLKGDSMRSKQGE